VLLILVDIVILLSAACFIVLAGADALHHFGKLSFPFIGYDAIIYLAPALLFVGTAIDRILRHRQKVHTARLEDRSEVERLFLNPALAHETGTPVMAHLEKLGPEGWTEYQVLPLRQLIVESLAFRVSSHGSHNTHRA
jgi:hypothetical protein